MAGWKHSKGDTVATIEERIEELEELVRYLRRARAQDDALTKAAAGQLRKAKTAESLEDIKTILLIVAGQLDATGKGR
jgi:hypothetical protein